MITGNTVALPVTDGPVLTSRHHKAEPAGVEWSGVAMEPDEQDISTTTHTEERCQLPL